MLSTIPVIELSGLPEEGCCIDTVAAFTPKFFIIILFFIFIFSIFSIIIRYFMIKGKITKRKSNILVLLSFMVIVSIYFILLFFFPELINAKSYCAWGCL